MKKNVSFDTLINHIIYTIDYIFKDDDPPQKLKNYLYLAVAGMVLNYEDYLVEEIYDTLTKIKFKLLSNQKSISKGMFYNNCLDNNYLFRKIDCDNGKSSLNYKYELIIDDLDDSPIKTLEFLVYQLNNIMFYKKKKISLGESIKIKFDYLRNEIVTNNDMNEGTMSKVFNALQSEDIIKKILELKNADLKNNKFIEALAMLDDIDIELYKIEGMDALVNLFRPLYCLDEIKKSINSLDNINLLEKEIDSILGRNTYKKISNKMELLDGMIHLCEKGINHNYYEISLEYVSIRNEFIKKYIKLKCA